MTVYCSYVEKLLKLAACDRAVEFLVWYYEPWYRASWNLVTPKRSCKISCTYFYTITNFTNSYLSIIKIIRSPQQLYFIYRNTRARLLRGSTGLKHSQQPRCRGFVYTVMLDYMQRTQSEYFKERRCGSVRCSVPL